jgi:hypothetical protein
MYTEILKHMRRLLEAQRDLGAVGVAPHVFAATGGGATDTDLGETVLHANTIRELACKLEMKEPSKRNYRTREVVQALQKEVRG